MEEVFYGVCAMCFFFFVAGYAFGQKCADLNWIWNSIHDTCICRRKRFYKVMTSEDYTEMCDVLLFLNNRGSENDATLSENAEMF